MSQKFFHGHFLHPDAELVQQGYRVRLTGDEPVGWLADHADAHVLEAGTGFLDRGQHLDPSRDIRVGAMQDLPLEPLLTQVGKDFQRRSQGVALAGSQEIVPLGAAGQHFRQEGLEDALRSARADVDEIQRMRAEIREIGAAEDEIPLREYLFQELVREFGDGRLVMEARSDGIDGDHGWIRKKGKLITSHRYDLLPLLHSCPGGVQRELVV